MIKLKNIYETIMKEYDPQRDASYRQELQNIKTKILSAINRIPKKIKQKEVINTKNDQEFAQEIESFVNLPSSEYKLIVNNPDSFFSDVDQSCIVMFIKDENIVLVLSNERGFKSIKGLFRKEKDSLNTQGWISYPKSQGQPANIFIKGAISSVEIDENEDYDIILDKTKPETVLTHELTHYIDHKKGRAKGTRGYKKTGGKVDFTSYLSRGDEFNAEYFAHLDDLLYKLQEDPNPYQSFTKLYPTRDKFVKDMSNKFKFQHYNKTYQQKIMKRLALEYDNIKEQLKASEDLFGGL